MTLTVAFDLETDAERRAFEELRDNETGFVDLSVTWTGLAARDGDRLVVSRPFSGDFQPERTFRLIAPEGYALTSVDPPASSSAGTSGTWAAGTSLDGFRAVAAPAGGTSPGTPTDTGSPTPTDAGTGTSGSGPGFGPGAALVAVVTGAALAGRRG